MYAKREDSEETVCAQLHVLFEQIAQQQFILREIGTSKVIPPCFQRPSYGIYWSSSSSNKTGGIKWNVIGPVGHELGGCPPPLLLEQILSIKSWSTLKKEANMNMEYLLALGVYHWHYLLYLRLFISKLFYIGVCPLVCFAYDISGTSLQNRNYLPWKITPVCNLCFVYIYFMAPPPFQSSPTPPQPHNTVGRTLLLYPMSANLDIGNTFSIMRLSYPKCKNDLQHSFG